MYFSLSELKSFREDHFHPNWEFIRAVQWLEHFMVWRLKIWAEKKGFFQYTYLWQEVPLPSSSCSLHPSYTVLILMCKVGSYVRCWICISLLLWNLLTIPLSIITVQSFWSYLLLSEQDFHLLIYFHPSSPVYPLP